MNNEIYRFNIGGFECYSLFDGYYEGGKAESLFFGADDKILEEEIRINNLIHDEIHLPCTCLYINTAKEKILVDTGYGNYSNENPFAKNAGRLLNNLYEIGITPEQIDIVILTHCDGDHLGGAIDNENKPLFKNARYLISRIEWNFWEKEIKNKELQEDLENFINKYLMSLENKIEFLDDGDKIADGITSYLYPGHSSGHLTLELSSMGKKLICMSDIVCHDLHVKYPNWKMFHEFDKELAVESRIKMFESLAQNKSLAHAFHLPFPAVGYIKKDDIIFSWHPI